MTRLIPGFKKLAYAERLKRLGITTLEQRRKRGDLIQLFKIFNNIDQVKFCAKPSFKSNAITRGHHQKYSREICINEIRQNFITWNELSNEAFYSESVNEFKIKMDQCLNELVQ